MIKIICFFKGHKPVRYLTETDDYFLFHRCERCRVPLGLPKWKWKNIPPPKSTPDEIVEWQRYCEEQDENIRNSFK